MINMMAAVRNIDDVNQERKFRNCLEYRAVTLPIIGQRKIWTQSKFCTWQNSVRGQEPPKMYIQCISPGDSQTSCKVCLTSAERCRCSNEAKTRNPLKFAGVTQIHQPISAHSGPKFRYCEDLWRRYCCLTSFFPILDTCLNGEDIGRQRCAMVHRRRFFCFFFAGDIFAS